MDLPSAKSDGSAMRLQAGAAFRLDSVLAMRTPWRALADKSDVPTGQFEWCVAAMNQLGPKTSAHIAYVTDGANMRAVLPLMVRSRVGVDQLEFLSPAIPVPIEVPSTDRPSVDMLLRSVIRLGKPIILNRILEQSTAFQVLKGMLGDRRAMIEIRPAEPVTYVGLGGLTLQDRMQSAARVSILATSYGLSGGPNDVIFQYVSPSLEQVMTLFHESLQLHVSSQPPEPAAKKGKVVKKELDTFEFLRTHAFHSAQRGEVRFSCLRLAGRLLAVQMFQVRKRTAWLLTAASLERFRGTTLSGLLMGETVRKLQGENVDRLIAPAGGSLREIGECKELPCADVRIYPWSPRSVTAMMMRKAGSASGRIFRRKSAEPGA